MKPINKIMILVSVLILCNTSVNGQEKMFLRRTTLVSVKKDKQAMIIRKFKKTEGTPKGFFRSNKKVSPKLSLELLDNSGLHLFSISNMAGLPDMRVGARIKAGLIINI